MQEEIGKTAGEIWHALNGNGELSLAQLKNRVKADGPIFDWAVGWLAREDKIAIHSDKRSIRIRLKETEARAAAA